MQRQKDKGKEKEVTVAEPDEHESVHDEVLPETPPRLPMEMREDGNPDEDGESIVVRSPPTLMRVAKVPPPKGPPRKASLPPPPVTPKQPSRPSSRGKAPAIPPVEDPLLGLDTSILSEAPRYTTAKAVVEDEKIMAPPMEPEEDEGVESPLKDSRKTSAPRTVASSVSSALSSPVTPSAVKPDITREYSAALHSRAAKITYSSTNKSIKRKAEEESPELAATARRIKKDVGAVVGGDGGTTYENLRQLSLGLRVRRQRGGEVF